MTPNFKEHALGIPILQMAQIGAYVVRQRLAGRKRFPLVLMLEPLFRCNLACAGCGKIDYPDKILNQRLPARRLPRGDRRMRRAGRRDRRRRALAAQGSSRRLSKARSRRRQIRDRLHQCSSSWKKPRPLHAEPLLQLVDSPRRRRRNARSVGLSGMAFTTAPSTP